MTTTDKGDAKPKTSQDFIKVVVRNFPLNEETTADQELPDIFEEWKENIEGFYRLKNVCSMDQQQAVEGCRLYIVFREVENALQFNNQWDQCFVDNNQLIVELAPYPKITKPTRAKVDPKQSTIDQDAEYECFVKLYDSAVSSDLSSKMKGDSATVSLQVQQELLLKQMEKRRDEKIALDAEITPLVKSIIESRNNVRKEDSFMGGGGVVTFKTKQKGEADHRRRGFSDNSSSDQFAVESGTQLNKQKRRDEERRRLLDKKEKALKEQRERELINKSRSSFNETKTEKTEMVRDGGKKDKEVESTNSEEKSVSNSDVDNSPDVKRGRSKDNDSNDNERDSSAAANSTEREKKQLQESLDSSSSSLSSKNATTSTEKGGDSVEKNNNDDGQQKSSSQPNNNSSVCVKSNTRLKDLPSIQIYRPMPRSANKNTSQQPISAIDEKHNSFLDRDIENSEDNSANRNGRRNRNFGRKSWKPSRPSRNEGGGGGMYSKTDSGASEYLNYSIKDGQLKLKTDHNNSSYRERKASPESNSCGNSADSGTGGREDNEKKSHGDRNDDDTVADSQPATTSSDDKKSSGGPIIVKYPRETNTSQSTEPKQSGNKAPPPKYKPPNRAERRRNPDWNNMYDGSYGYYENSGGYYRGSANSGWPSGRNRNVGSASGPPAKSNTFSRQGYDQYGYGSKSSYEFYNRNNVESGRKPGANTSSARGSKRATVDEGRVQSSDVKGPGNNSVNQAATHKGSEDKTVVKNDTNEISKPTPPRFSDKRRAVAATSAAGASPPDVSKLAKP